MVENSASVEVTKSKYDPPMLAVVMGVTIALGAIYIAVPNLLAANGAIIYDLFIHGTSSLLTSLFEAIPVAGLFLTLALVVGVLLERRRNTVTGFSILLSFLACPFFSCATYINLVTNHRLFVSDPQSRHLADVSLNNFEYRLAYHPNRGRYRYALYECDSLKFACRAVYNSNDLEHSMYNPAHWSLVVDSERRGISVLYNNTVHYTYTPNTTDG